MIPRVSNIGKKAKEILKTKAKNPGRSKTCMRTCTNEIDCTLLDLYIKAKFVDIV